MRVTSLTMEALFISHVASMAETGILVARHGPLVADSLFLPPGALVLELLPYKWEWRNISTLNFNITQSTGVIHHVAWRPMDVQWCLCVGRRGGGEMLGAGACRRGRHG